ncbi:MAG: LysR family transcriptional regulator [Alphaproteobacteria bacterium]|nr:LysR family transcriptional regulator [Alphaproteobacteria bacterium]
MEILYARALSHFIAAYDYRNLRAAAEVVHVTQPAISKSIGKLENHIGMPLFKRTPDGVRPTEFAHMLRQHAQNIVNEARFVETEIAALTEGSGGLVRIGVGPAWSLSVFPTLLAGFRAVYPNIDIEVQTGVTDHLLPQLIDGDIDVWLGSLHDIDESDEIAVTRVGWSDMTVFASTSHPLVSHTPVKPDLLCKYDWTSFTNDQKGLEHLNYYFHSRGLPLPRVALRLSSLVTMFSIAGSSDLLVYTADTLHPEAESRNLTEIKLSEPIWGFDTGMAFRRSTSELAGIKLLNRLLKGHLPGQQTNTADRMAKA